MNVKHIFLSITEKCNLNCVYCFEKSKRSDVMSFETAMMHIDQAINDPNTEKLTIDFMGGEPFIEFDRIKEICEAVWSKYSNKNYVFFAATNGTLVHGEIKQWLEEHHEQFICALSIDGIKEAHDINRTKSFDKIDKEFFVKMWPNVRAKTLCSKESLTYLAESVKYIHNLGFKSIDLKLAYSFDWSDKAEMAELQRQFDLLIDFYLDNPEYKPASLLNIDLMELNYPNKPIKKWCTLGSETLSIDMNGDKYPCRYFQDLVRANKLTYDEMWKVDYANIHNQLKGKCTKCLVRDVCRTCYAYNLDSCGDFGVKNNYSCELSRISALSTAKLCIAKLDKKSELNADDKLIIEKAQQIINAKNSGNWFIYC